LISLLHICGRAKQIVDHPGNANHDLLGRFSLRFRRMDARKLNHLRRRIGAILL
jgi:hypothetical protein